MKKTFLSTMAFALCVGAVITSCSKDEVEPAGMQGNNNSTTEVGPSQQQQATGIPSDELAAQSMPGEISGLTDENSNTAMSNPSYYFTDENGYTVLNFDMTGIQSGSSAWLNLQGTAAGEKQNVWVTIDGTPKGIDVYNTSEGQGSRKMLADVVFLVDDSGSMYEEADAIARDIVAWSKALTQSGLDVQFGCVGYGDNYPAIDGAVNITTSDKLSDFLNRDGSYGTYRTQGYAGDDATALKEAVVNYNHQGWDECGMAALRFAKDQFKYRPGSNRVYINFTDEPNQPSGDANYSVEKLKDANFWTSANGTIHSVFSEDTTYGYWSELYSERPWLMSDYTGGTKIFTDASFQSVTLESLPVSGALQNSYKIRISNVNALKDGKPHEVKIIVYANSGAIIAVKTLYVVFA